MGRHANPDIRRAFAEFQDSDTPSKCNKVRCLHCGFVRAKNTTRQIEHLQDCQAYLQSPEAQAHLQQQQQSVDEPRREPSASQGPRAPSILNGQHPNPNLQVNRRGPNSKRARDGQLIAPHPQPQPQMVPAVAPSLTSHLLAICHAQVTAATQQPFLSHAGCGSLAAAPLSQWLVQDAHYARAYMRFVGQLLAKIRLPQTVNSQFHPMYRTMDLLISALNNMRREMQFFEITATKFGLQLHHTPPAPITRALLDLFVSASSASASLLEGMVLLWGIEHVYRTAWQYAHSFSTSLSTPSTDSHIVALHQALIPNWTSPAFYKFVDACRALVDELANITTTRDGREEMSRCEEIFRQVCWIEERFWPQVNGMGEEDDSGRRPAPAPAPMSAGLGPINNGINGPSMNGPMSRSNMAPNMNPNMNPNMTPTMNRNMNGSMNNQNFSGSNMNSQPVNNSIASSTMQGPSMNSQMSTQMSNQMSAQPATQATTENEENDDSGMDDGEGDSSPEDDSRNDFSLESVNQAVHGD